MFSQASENEVYSSFSRRHWKLLQIHKRSLCLLNIWTFRRNRTRNCSVWSYYIVQPPSKVNKLINEIFCSKFTALLELLSPNRGCSELVLAGDFNCHVNDQNNQPGFKFSQILYSFDFTEHTNVATHKRDHTLDLIITRSENRLVQKPWVLDPAILPLIVNFWLQNLPFLGNRYLFEKLARGIDMARSTLILKTQDY